MRGLYVRLRNIKAQCGSYGASCDETRSATGEQAPDMKEDDLFSMEGENEDLGAEDCDPKTCPTYMLDPDNRLDDSD